MYSHEIEEYLKIRDYLLTAKEYIKILQESPQIDHIICDNGLFYLWTKDNYKFILKIKEEK